MTTPVLLGNIIGAFVGTVGFSIMYNVPKKYYLGCGITGLAGWMMYLFVVQKPYMSPALASFCGAFVVVLISRILTVRLKCPITIFLISGIFPMVPGAGVYYTAYYLVTNQLSEAASRGLGALKVAFGIVMGIVIVVSIPREVFQIFYWKDWIHRKRERQVEKEKKE